MADPRTCTATWHAPGSDWQYPCNVLDQDPTDGRLHRYPDIHTFLGDDLTIEWTDARTHPTQPGQTP